MKTIIACSIVLLCSFSAEAQTCTEANTQANPCLIKTGQSLVASFDHDGANTVDYRLWLDGAPVGANVPVSTLLNGVVTLPAITLTAVGSHRIEVSASNGTDMVKSSPIYVSASLPAPSAPKQFKITIAGVVASDGTLSGLTLTAVEVK